VKKKTKTKKEIPTLFGRALKKKGDSWTLAGVPRKVFEISLDCEDDSGGEYSVWILNKESRCEMSLDQAQRHSEVELLRLATLFTSMIGGGK
jgi:hypothetical protein